MRKLFNKQMVRYVTRTAIIIMSTQIVFLGLLSFTSVSSWVATTVALVSMLLPGLWLDKRFVWKNDERFTRSEVVEFLAVSTAPTVITPAVVGLAGDQPPWALSGVMLGVFGVFWVVRFVLHKKRWVSTNEDKAIE